MINGRAKIPFVCGPRAHQLLTKRQGESDLVYRHGHGYLFATVSVSEESPYDPEEDLGGDLGIARIATDRDGQSFCGAHTRNLRKRHRRLRSRLQQKQTKSAKRRLRARRKKEARYATDVNHLISEITGRKSQTHEAGDRPGRDFRDSPAGSSSEGTPS